MPPLKTPRKGYEAQILGGMLLYQLSFLSEPMYIADDIGIDFSCTIFDENERTESGRRYTELIPKNTFAIQIKKTKDVEQKEIDLTKYLLYLANLELPFFLGLADLEKTNLKIFSGEFLSPFFAFKNIPVGLKAQLCEKTDIPIDYGDWCHKESEDDEKYVIPFPKVAEISAKMNDCEIKEQSAKISNDCSAILNNIASYKLKKYLFNEPVHNQQLLFTNTSWDPYLLKNFVEPLSLMFFHLGFMQSQGHDRKDDFVFFESIYKHLKGYFHEDTIPGLLNETYEECKKHFNF